MTVATFDTHHGRLIHSVSLAADGAEIVVATKTSRVFVQPWTYPRGPGFNSPGQLRLLDAQTGQKVVMEDYIAGSGLLLDGAASCVLMDVAGEEVALDDTSGKVLAGLFSVDSASYYDDPPLPGPLLERDPYTGTVYHVPLTRQRYRGTTAEAIHPRTQRHWTLPLGFTVHKFEMGDRPYLFTRAPRRVFIADPASGVLAVFPAG